MDLMIRCWHRLMLVGAFAWGFWDGYCAALEAELDEDDPRRQGQQKAK
jgi:hypothetical protein